MSLLFLTVAGQAQSLPGLQGCHRILILGDSITYAGTYVDDLHAWVAAHDPHSTAEFLNLGLPSETVSGLSEPGHAGGKFRRPDLHERLARILAQTKPDLVIACYGMNDGIYQPLDQGRFQKFQAGIQWLHDQVTQTGARIIHVTPPVYDPVAGHAKPFADGTDYNTVLDRYSAWLLDQRTNHWDVIDIHTPMNHFLEDRRKANPAFTLTRDGIHPGAEGHWLMAREILVHLGAPAETASMAAVTDTLPGNLAGTNFLKTITQQDDLLRNAWLSETKYLRPGIAAGLPLPQAQVEAARLQARIQAMAATP